MSDILKKRIEKISDEVRELHPFLDELFRSIPDVSSVSYTHGPNEKGADFLLSLKPGFLGEEELIGVLVKVGKISSDLTAIDRQVDECKERRFSQNGKKEVYLSEIWVVANGTISHRAQEKIWERHRASKIKFIDLDKLADLASMYVPHFGMDMPTSVASYLKSQSSEAIKRDGIMSLLPAAQADMYLDQDIVEVDSGRSSPISKRRKVDIFKEIESEKVLVVEAPMGGGKSKLLNVISKHYCKEEAFSETKTIPVYLHAKDVFSDSFPGVLEWLGLFKSKNGLADFSDLKFLLLVDGLDEVNSDENDLSGSFSDFVSSVVGQNDVKALIATRMISSEPLEAVVDRKCARYEIRPLSIVKIIEFISGICSEFSVHGRLLEDLKKSAIYKALPKTPISAIILATLINEGASELPSSMTELYSQYCELSLGRWDADKGLGSIKEYEVATAVIEEIAEYFMDNEIPSISYGEAVGFFKRYLDARNLKLDSDEIISKVLSRSDILIFDKKAGIVGFKHRSFVEYYYARRKLNGSARDVNEKIFHPYWSGSFFFYVGLRKDCPELLKEIISLPVSHEGLRLSKLVNLSGFLLAGYKSPYDVVVQGIREIFIEAGNYYYDVSINKESSVLSQFPALHLLGLFRALMRESYSFDFFADAINEVNEEIATQPSKTEATAYSLYLLDIVRADLGIPKAFDKLIDVYDKSLPLALQVAISDAVSKDKEHASPAMKKLEKKMRKAFKASSPLRAEVRRIAYESIDGKYDMTAFLSQRRLKKKR